MHANANALEDMVRNAHRAMAQNETVTAADLAAALRLWRWSCDAADVVEIVNALLERYSTDGRLMESGDRSNPPHR
jgi:hypothetical protein